MLRILALLGPLLGAAIRRAERRIQGELRAAHAVSADTAVAIVRESPLRRWRFNRLLNAGVVHAVDGQRFYWDEVAWKGFQRARRRRGLRIVGVVVAVLVTVWLITSVWLTPR